MQNPVSRYRWPVLRHSTSGGGVAQNRPTISTPIYFKLDFRFAFDKSNSEIGRILQVGIVVVSGKSQEGAPELLVPLQVLLFVVSFAADAPF